MKKAQPQITPVTHNILEQVLDPNELPKSLAQVKNSDEIKIVYFGTPEFSAYILEKLIEFCQNPSQPLQLDVRSSNEMATRYQIQAVVTRTDKRVGRKQDLRSSPVAQVAQKYQIPILKPVKLNEEFIKTNLALLTSDLFVVASYGKIIPQSLLDIPQYGSLNVHGSILPKHRGASPIQAAILNGDKTTGITIMLMDAEMDHGPIISTKEIKISEQVNLQTLSKKMMQVAALLLIETLVKFVEGKVKPQVQNHTRATYCKLLTKDSGYFEIQNPPTPEVLDRMVRAYYPWPGVWTRWKGKIVKFLPEGKIQIEGKKPISFKDFLNGYPDFSLQKLVY